MLTRRSFVQGSTAVFGFGLFSCRAAPKTLPRSPNEEVRIAVVGVRSRGNAHVKGYWNVPNVKVVAICDVDRDVLAKRAAEYEGEGHPVETFVDLRDVLDRADIDAVSIATPNHLHALQAIWACQAGKDVYLEKPVSHNIWEGGQIVRAAQKYDRVVTTGTQCRSSEGIAAALAWVRAGNLGDIRLARGLCYKPRKSIGKVTGPTTPPASVDYDLWTGPAPLKPLMRERLHYDWHWVFDTGNGDVGNQGIHQMDLARWALGEEGFPHAVSSIGGRFGYDDDGNTPNTQIVMLEYESAPLFFEVRGLPRNREAQETSWNGAGMDDFMGAKIGVIVHCEGGLLRIPSYDSAIAYDGDGNEVQRWKGASDHFAHFVDVLRSRRHEDQRADIRQGHVSSAMCHMGNVSHALGEGAGLDTITSAVQDDVFAAEAWQRMRAHLEANGVDLARTPVTLGPRLTFDAEREHFGHGRANELLAREYRAPFVVPERV
jgi:predicted dehydrogenase